jgi:tRNA-uridine 2-sulfurtransferase
MTKALVMFSGGLDSLLAIKILEKQNIECTALTFTTPFFTKEKAKKQAEKFNIKFMSVDITDPHFQVLKNPIYWHGKNLNPCIDCHGLMFKIAGEIADQQWFQIIASGEVLGQRPMSQNKKSLNSVRKLAWRDILRPLSGKLLPPTIYETNWLIDKNQLLDISGRWRKKQIQLAEELWLQWYNVPWGGCVLTEPGYANKLKLLFESFPKDILPIDAEILKFAKLEIFQRWFVMIWKDNNTNTKIQEILEKNQDSCSTRYNVLILKDITGPICIVRNINWYKDFTQDCKNLYKQKISKLKNLDNFDFLLF